METRLQTLQQSPFPLWCRRDWLLDLRVRGYSCDVQRYRGNEGPEGFQEIVGVRPNHAHRHVLGECEDVAKGFT